MVQMASGRWLLLHIVIRILGVCILPRAIGRQNRFVVVLAGIRLEETVGHLVLAAATALALLVGLAPAEEVNEAAVWC